MVLLASSPVILVPACFVIWASLVAIMVSISASVRAVCITRRTSDAVQFNSFSLGFRFNWVADPTRAPVESGWCSLFGYLNVGGKWSELLPPGMYTVTDYNGEKIWCPVTG